MTAAWNFEKRRDTCTAFVIGVHGLATGLPDRETSLEAVRHRMKLSSEEALFAARKLDEEGKLSFDPAGAIRSSARGIAAAEALMVAVRSKMRSYEEVQRVLGAGGSALAVLRAAIRTQGDALACGGPEDQPDAAYRLTLSGDAVVLELQP